MKRQVSPPKRSPLLAQWLATKSTPTQSQIVVITFTVDKTINTMMTSTTMSNIFLLLLSLFLLDETHGFSLINRYQNCRIDRPPLGQHRLDRDGHNCDGQETGRREFIKDGTAAALGAVITLPSAAAVWSQQSTSAVAAETGEPSSKPFCVIGANGRTGTKIVQDILNRGFPVRATSRSGVYNGDITQQVADTKKESEKLLVPMVCDVTDASTIRSALDGTRAVIFAASASKAGGTPAQVDNDGLVSVAKACIELNIPHLVVVSSGSVSKPDSPVFKFLNIFGRIMEEKIKGEDEVRSMYRLHAQQQLGQQEQLPTYTIIRPGGLTEDPPRGVTAIELNQGDEKTGRISRYDVASLCVESTFYPKVSGGTTFECYDYDTGKTLQAVGLSNILKQKAGPSEPMTGYEQRGSSYQELFTGLQKD